MNVLFVCLGNICRSPSAEGVFREMTSNSVDSAGTSGWHIGDAPYEPMLKAASRRGYDFSDLRARKFVSDDFNRFDLIIGMDDQNLVDIEALRPAGNTVTVRKLTDFASTRTEGGVPDPYYTGDFDGALDLIEDCASGLKAEIG